MDARHTKIEQIIETAQGILVREAYFGHPEGVSNIYLVRDQEIVWEAELPMKGDLYTNSISVDGYVFLCASWKGVDCTISLKNGAILRRQLRK